MNYAKTYDIKGMHCASCANTIEKTFKAIPGVQSAEVNFGTETAKVVFDEKKTNAAHLSSVIEPLGYTLAPVSDDTGKTAHEMGMSADEHAAHTGLNQSRAEKLAELSAMKRNVISVIPLVIVSVFVMTWDILAQSNIVSAAPYFWKEFFHHLLPLMATYVLFVVGKPYLLGVYRFVRYGHANMDSLVGIGTLAAYIYSFIVSAFEESLRPFIDVDMAYYDVTIVVIAFIAFGKYLEMRSKIKTGDAIQALMGLQAKTALVRRDGKEIEVAIDTVVRDDLVIIKPAGKIPVDGVVVEGDSYVDESMVTGEPVPVQKEEGDTVVAGTMNTSGSFVLRATNVGSETMLSNIIKMVADAQGSKAPIQGLADKISAVFIPIVLVIATVSLGVWLFVGTMYLGFPQALSYGLVSFVGILVIACPCALGLATPTAIIVGVGKGAREGILIKDAAALEMLHKVGVMVVDKTGTITQGKPALVSIRNYSSKTDHELISLLASLEDKSEHPLARAIMHYADEHTIALKPVKSFEALKGKGVRGVIGATEYYAGNSTLIQSLKLEYNIPDLENDTREGKTPIILATAEKILGLVMVADAVKPESASAVRRLHAMGITVVMLTGDNKNTAQFIAQQVGIEEVYAQVTPEQKRKKIKELQSRGVVVAMAGDGVNDAPALAQADIGIAMATGTDVAIESAGITLLHGDISKLAKAVSISKITMRGIRQNLFWAFIYNIIGIPVAAGVLYPFFGMLLSPVFAGLAMALSSVSVVGNSLRIKNKRL